MGTWTAPTFVDTLKARLEARAGLAGVQVNSAPMGDSTKPEAITFHAIEGEQEFRTLGRGPNTKDDSYTVWATVWINKPGQNEAVAKSARDRADAILGEVEDELRLAATETALNAALGGQLHHLNLANIDLEQTANAEGRVAQVTFRISVRVRI